MSAGRHHAVRASAWLALLLVATAAHADAQNDGARAQKLFDDALKAMQSGSFATACPMLAESFALDPAGGTALDLGFCFEHEGRLASALHAYERAREIADTDDRADRSQSAKDKISELEKTVGHIRLVAPLDSWRSEKWHAFVDGVPVTSDDLSVPTPVDRGEHVVTITAPDKHTYERRVSVNDGVTTDVVVDGLVDAGVLPPPAPPKQLEPTAAAPSYVLRDDVPRRNWGIGIGSVGIVALGVGTVGAIAAASLHAQSNDACPTTGCTGGGVDSEKQADRMAWVADIGFVAGAALVGVGTYLFFTARHAQRVPTMSSVMSGRFAFDIP